MGGTALVSCLMRSFRAAASAVSMLNLGAIARSQFDASPEINHLYRNTPQLERGRPPNKKARRVEARLTAEHGLKSILRATPEPPRAEDGKRCPNPKTEKDIQD